MNNRHFRNPIVSKMLIVQINPKENKSASVTLGKSNAKMLSPAERPSIKSIICALRGKAGRAAKLMKPCVDVRRCVDELRGVKKIDTTDAHRRTLSYILN